MGDGDRRPDPADEKNKAAEEKNEAEERAGGRMAWLGEVVRAWGPAILAVILIRAFIFEPFRIPSGSMVPTLQIGDHVLVTRFSYGIWLPFLRKELVDLGDPERGDIIVFRYPRDESMHYIKRVVAIPGDTIRVQNNQVILNGVPQEREYVGRVEWIDSDCRPHRAKRYIETIGEISHDKLTDDGLGSMLANMSREITVPPGHVFVMGDNRDNSEDSRQWSFVRFDQIKGKAHFVWLSWDRCAGGFGELRMDRFFHNLYEKPVVEATASP